MYKMNINIFDTLTDNISVRNIFDTEYFLSFCPARSPECNKLIIFRQDYSPRDNSPTDNSPQKIKK